MKKYSEKVYFEDWYLKIVDAKNESVLGITIHLDRVNEKNEGMLQLVYDTGVDRKKFSSPIQDIKSDKEELLFGENKIGAKSFSVNIKNEDMVLEGDLVINEVIDLNQSFLKPGLMGPYKHIPMQEFYEEVLALHGIITGELYINGEKLDLNAGRYYLQKQWGSRFPNIWLWAQCSGCEKKKDLSLAVGIARLKVLFNYYTAFAIPIYYDDQVEIFSNYNGGHIAKLYRYKGYVHLIITQKDKMLDLKIYGRDEMECISSKVIHGIRDVYECDRVKMEIKITQNGNILLEDTSLECSIEMGGNTSKLK